MYSASINNSVFTVEKSNGSIKVNDIFFQWDITKTGDYHYQVVFEEKSFNLELVSIDQESKTVILKLNNKPCEIQIKDKFDLLLDKLGLNMATSTAAKDIKAPMPGLIFDIKVKEGDEVKKGDPVLILEAMKMENILKSPGDGTVQAIKIKKGESVEKNQVLIQF
ncbi:acetyl-CoA carboxylase biotin carboxyl carrier protein subunit [Arthrospiribacter ruber]|uniref:Acetyl-CoA carboxylase biotin carboxyl carrier protein subunit n=1 Tax=Arthrospiribacter ruber TaxID=2487934 RepID=A0A951IZ02_9BACT|nr:acetyl-CoA carboxylase biotin carboxyl carrier protein subunit [Arthrospiribacter ruber]MBW3468869.1 acetyl-CoA carboxylase biotin carboxyl carrier protein subunit [Arthrospiribacter ruber]